MTILSVLLRSWVLLLKGMSTAVVVGIVALVLPIEILAQTASQQKNQTKAKVQVRERYEYENDLPTYTEQLKTELTYPMAWGNSTEHDFSRWRAEARSIVFRCMLTPPKAADNFDITTIAEEKRDGYTARLIEYNANAYTRARALMLIPDGKGPFPAINMLHDHGAHLFIGKEKMIRPFACDSMVIADAEEWTELYGGRFPGDYMARHGYVVFSADAPLWGERGRREGVDRSRYDIIAGNMMMLGRNLCAFMHYDDITTTEMLAQMTEVDSTRIGAFGCSMGAYRAWMLSALTDRVKCAAAVCWMTTTDHQLSVRPGSRRENGGFANALPGLRQYLDYPHIAAIACPKPALFINGTMDKLFSEQGTRETYNEMDKVWRSQGVAERFEAELWHIPHSCGISVQERAMQFFNKWLKE